MQMLDVWLIILVGLSSEQLQSLYTVAVAFAIVFSHASYILYKMYHCYATVSSDTMQCTCLQYYSESVSDTGIYVIVFQF